MNNTILEDIDELIIEINIKDFISKNIKKIVKIAKRINKNKEEEKEPDEGMSVADKAFWATFIGLGVTITTLRHIAGDSVDMTRIFNSAMDKG